MLLLLYVYVYCVYTCMMCSGEWIDLNPVRHSRSICWHIRLHFEISNNHVSKSIVNDGRDCDDSRRKWMMWVNIYIWMNMSWREDVRWEMMENKRIPIYTQYGTIPHFFSFEINNSAKGSQSSNPEWISSSSIWNALLYDSRMLCCFYVKEESGRADPKRKGKEKKNHLPSVGILLLLPL